MALLLEKTNGNGVTTEYHRIAAFIPDFDNRAVQVALRSYTAAAYRATEKAQLDAASQITVLQAQIEALLLDPTSENEQERIDLSNELNTLVENQSARNEYFVTEQKIELSVPAEFDYTRASIYTILKQGQFADAEDC